MKKPKHYHFQTISVTVACSLLIFFVSSCETVKKNYDSKVMDAYELRMSGNADSAKVLLEQIINEDSTCAVAWYEMSRTEQHTGLGNMRALKDHLNNALFNIEQAVKYEQESARYLYFKGVLQSFDLYMKLQMEGGNLTVNLQQIEGTYLKVLEINPQVYEAKLSLVELFYFIPPDMGGDSIKAEDYAQELEKEDLVCGAKAREILMAEDADYITFWSDLIAENENNAELIEALGRIYLYENDVEKAWANFETVLQMDNSKNYLYRDMGRFYTMQAMQGQITIDSAVPLIVAEYENYLFSQPEPCNSMKAWAKGQMAMLKFRTGDEEDGNLLLEEAKTLDPYFSRAFGAPDKKLFIPPDAVSYDFAYLSRPF